MSFRLGQGIDQGDRQSHASWVVGLQWSLSVNYGKKSSCLSWQGAHQEFRLEKLKTSKSIMVLLPGRDEIVRCHAV